MRRRRARAVARPRVGVVLQKQLDETADLNARLEAAAAEACGERDEARARASSLEERESDLLQELNAMAANAESIRRDAGQTEALEAEISSLEVQLESKMLEADKMKAKADKGHDLLFESNQERNRLEKSLVEISEKSDQSEKALAAKEEELQSALLVVADLKKHLSETHEKKVDLETALATMKEELAASNDILDKELQSREREVKEVNGLLVRLKKSNDQADDLKAQLIQVQSDFGLQSAASKETEAKMQAEISQLKESLNDFASLERDDQEEKDLAAARLDIESKERTIERLTLKLSQTDVLVQELEKKSSGLEQIAEEKVAAYSNEAKEVENLRDYIKQQKMRLDAKDGNARALTSLIKDLHTLTKQLSP